MFFKSWTTQSTWCSLFLRNVFHSALWIQNRLLQRRLHGTSRTRKSLKNVFLNGLRGIPFPPTVEEIVESVQIVQDRVQQSIEEQIVDAPVPQIVEEQLVAVAPTPATTDATFPHEHFDEACRILALKQAEVRQAAITSQACDAEAASKAWQAYESAKAIVENIQRELGTFRALRQPSEKRRREGTKNELWTVREVATACPERFSKYRALFPEGLRVHTHRGSRAFCAMRSTKSSLVSVCLSTKVSPLFHASCVWLSMTFRSVMSMDCLEKGGDKKGFQNCVDFNGYILLVRAIQGHSGGNKVHPSLQDNAEITYK